MSRFSFESFRLRQEVADLRVEVARLRRQVQAKEQVMAQAIDERNQARRDCELLALMAKDRRVALEFVRDAHDIRKLDEMEDAW